VSAPSSGPQTLTSSNIPRLRRVLGLWDLILYGIVAVTLSALRTRGFTTRPAMIDFSES